MGLSRSVDSASKRTRLFLHPLICLLMLVLAPAMKPAHAGGISLEVISAWGGPVTAIQIVGDVCFAAVGQRLVALDISDPADITEIGSLNFRARVRDLAVQGDYAFVGLNEDPRRFTVVDVSDPSAMIDHIWEAVPPAMPFGVTGFEVDLHRNTAHVRMANSHLAVFDITDPTNVKYVTEFPGPGAIAVESVILGDRMYMATNEIGPVPSERGAGIRVYDLSGDPLHPVLLGSEIFVPASIENSAAYSIDVEGDYAYLTVETFVTGWHVYTVDISDPRNPTVVGSYEGSFFSPIDVAVEGGYVYVTDWTDSNVNPSVWQLAHGLVVLDASDPANLIEAATFKTHGAINGMHVVGNRAYLFDDGEGLIVLDVSNPRNPVRLGNYHSPALLRKMARVGDLLYVADAWNGFTILNVSNPDATPQVIGVYQTPFGPGGQNLGIDNWGIAVEGNRVYLSAGHSALLVVDVTNPASPQLLGSIQNPVIVVGPSVFPTVGRGLTVRNHVAHAAYQVVTCSNCCVTCPWAFANYDVTDPTQIVELGSVLVSGSKWAALTIALDEADGNVAFIAREGKPQRIDTDANGRPEPFEDPAVISSGDTLPGVPSGNHSCVDAAVDGNRLYLANFGVGSPYGGLFVKDITNPFSPTLPDVSATTTSLELGVANALAIQNQRLYLTTGGTLRVLSIANPSAPVELAPYFVLGGSIRRSVLVDEPIVYVADVFGAGLILVKVNGLPQAIPADLNGDGVVNTLDLGILLSSWTIPPRITACGGAQPCPADINHDGVVNTLDLGILLSSWTL